MNKFLGYRCSLCGQEYGPNEIKYTCPKDGGNLDVLLNMDAIRATLTPEGLPLVDEPSLWRYLPLLPVGDPGGQETILHAAGHTPVFAPPRLRSELGLPNFWVKDESRNPTASFKDRASAIVVARARETGAEVVVTASTGNAGAALAGMSAAVSQKAVIFAPRTAPPAKIAQLLVFGARVILVDGTYDDAFDLTIQAAEEFGWYCRNTGYNPFTVEGKKTAAFEVWEWFTSRVAGLPCPVAGDRRTIALGADLSKLCLFVSVGDGNIISGIHKGFKDLRDLGFIAGMPRVFGVQSEGSAAIANAYFAGVETITPVKATTLADSISVDLPRDGTRAVRAATQTDGQYILVPDAAIIQGIAALGKAGIFAEPAGATAYAGVVKAMTEGIVGPNDLVLAINTGSGLKDVRAAMMAVTEAPIITPALEEVKRILG